MILESIREELEYNRERVLYESIDVKELLEDYNELLEERVDMLIDMLNENAWDDLKVKKEDLMDPNKVKAIIRRIENERIMPTTKDSMLNILYSILILFVACAPGVTLVTFVGPLISNSSIIEGLGVLLTFIGPVIAGAVGAFSGSLEKYRIKTQNAIKKVEKKIAKEKDPKKLKAFKAQKEALEKNLRLFEKAEMDIINKRKKEAEKHRKEQLELEKIRAKNSHYNYNDTSIRGLYY